MPRVAELEQRGDTLRAEKAYLDALDYYRAPLAKEPNNARLYNKIGINELQMGRFAEARKDFERAIKNDRQFADAYNNLGVIYYLQKKYGKAIKQYEKAIKLRAGFRLVLQQSRSGVFLQKGFREGQPGLQPGAATSIRIFSSAPPTTECRRRCRLRRTGRTSTTCWPGFTPRAGVTDRSLQYLRRAMEEGYKGIDDVYKDSEFAGLRKDPRFTELMAARPVAIPE